MSHINKRKLSLPLLLAAASFTTAAFAGSPAEDPRNESFKATHPDQYASWAATSESEELVDLLEQSPNVAILFGGYGFAKDYNQARGHYYAVTDVRQTLRTGGPKTDTDGPMPMACWSCKSTDVTRLIDERGEGGYFEGKWGRLGAEVVNAIGCIDCHDTDSEEFKDGEPALKLGRPFTERALAAIGTPFAEADEYDQQAMVCSQCHVEYYFSGGFVKFPWDNGTTAEEMEKYFDDLNFKDWTHKISKAPMLKAQHPEYETWREGMHGKNGVTCADCHMPKVENEAGDLVTDHKIGNPFDRFEDTCGMCHDSEKEFLQDVVKSRKERVLNLKARVENQLVHAHFEAGAAWDAGATEAQMADSLKLIRHAQWRWDYAIASHGVHMHAPEVALEELGNALDLAGEARAQLARVLAANGVVEAVKLPDLSTKAAAQKALGMDMAAMEAEKDHFLKEIVPKWDEEAAKREANY